MATVAPTTDAALLRRLRARERGAWEELYAAFQPRLRAFAYRLAGNVHDADDLVQETFVRAVPRLDRLDPDTADVAAYLFTTLRNLFLKQVDRTKRQQPMAEVPEPALPTPIEGDPERNVLLVAQQDEVRVANARLQPRQRLVLALRELEDRSYAEIGELVGMKENAVAQLIFRARESLRVELRLVQVDPERLPEDCRRFLPLLASHLDGQLKGARCDETLAHLETCERCQAALADMREASRRYRVILLPLGADDARAAIEQRLDDGGYWNGTGRRGLRRRIEVAAGIGAVVAVLGGGAALGVAVSRDADVVEARATPTAPVVSLPSSPPTTHATRTAPTTTRTETRPPTTTSAPAPRKVLPTAPVVKKKPQTTKTVISKPVPKPRRVAPPPQPPSPPPPPTHVTVEAVAPKPKPKETAKPKPALPPVTTTAKPPEPEPARDTTAPEVTISAAPGASTSTDSAQVAFSANEADVSFQCRLDGGEYAACASPAALSGLAPGQHSFSVHGTDPAGNESPTATATWTYTPPDTTAPNVTISAAPPESTTATSASFSFSANEDGATFACALDGGSFAPCTSPVSYTGLGLGAHTFSARAADRAGNTSSAAVREWKIVAPLPDLLVGSLTKSTITVTNRGEAAAGTSILTVTLVGTFTVPGLAPGQSATFSWSTCRAGTYSAIVDRTNTVAESDESNNTASLANTCP
ncbi:MAG TPA: sigma-70 family RNA polymerase sigma factor [Gaiellaceae bacterium]